MAKIAVITTYPKFVYYISAIQQNCPNDEIVVYLKSDEKSVFEAITDAENSGCSAIVTGAFTYNLIFGRTNLPIVDVEAAYSDVITAWARIREKSLSPKHTVFFFRKDNPIMTENDLASKLATVLNTEVTIKTFTGKEDYETTLRNLNPNTDMVIAGEHSIDVCKELGIPNEFLQIGINTMNLGIQEAIHISNNLLHERIKNATLNAILNSSKDGIIYINKNKEVETINPIAIKLLHFNFAKDISLEQIIFKLGIFNESTIFTEGMFINEKLCSTSDGERLVITTTTLEVKDELEGIIIFLKEVDEIKAIEQKIRINSSSKGYVAKYFLSDIIGKSPQITECKRLARRFGLFSGNVLIYGETGTGKELFAHAIHNASTRADGPFYAINCAALPVNILESELFGYSEGSFTGAKKTGKAGIFELAHGGTLFLDEIGEMDLSCQSKLLRAIQEKEIRRVGDDKIIPIDVRIIAASNKNLYEEVEKGNFREDLLYRINVMSLVSPPLRERPEDILPLMNQFIEEYSNKYNIHAHFKFTEGAMKYIRDYSWRGNIRELRNFTERIFVYGYAEGLITEAICIKLITNNNKLVPSSFYSIDSVESPVKKSLSDVGGNMNQIENKLILEAIEKFGGNKTKAAEYLGVSRTYIWRRINKMKESQQ